ncbi:MAG: hypothetical protein FWD60_09595 [Candidatus Azobacteroides sp.]|nr:hypothetical protein [Candidatus Azobacteroides sp.]
MIRRDFLLQQIEEMGRVLGQILLDMMGLKNDAPVSRHIIEEARQTLQDETDLDIDQLMEIPPDKFIQALQENKAMNDANLDHFAAILFHIAENTDDKDKATSLYERSLIIYNYLDQSGEIYSFDRYYTIPLRIAH